MNRKRLVLVATIAIVGLGATGAAVVTASTGGDDSSDSPIVGDALQQASDAAIAATGGGRVTQTEVGDEDSYYEVEVTLDDGSQVDVQLDESFNLVKVMTDSDSHADD
jgi:uncharacterized membrane protein YkoI